MRRRPASSGHGSPPERHSSDLISEVRYGSNADIRNLFHDVRFVLEPDSEPRRPTSGRAVRLVGYTVCLLAQVAPLPLVVARLGQPVVAAVRLEQPVAAAAVQLGQPVAVVVLLGWPVVVAVRIGQPEAVAAEQTVLPPVAAAKQDLKPQEAACPASHLTELSGKAAPE